MKINSFVKSDAGTIIIVGGIALIVVYYVSKSAKEAIQPYVDKAKNTVADILTPPAWADAIDRKLGIGEYNNQPPPVSDTYPDESVRGGAVRRPVIVDPSYNGIGDDMNEGAPNIPYGISP